MDVPTLISRTSPFFNFRGFGGILITFLNLNRINCKQTVKILARRRIKGRLICVCTVCLCPIKGPKSYIGQDMEILVRDAPVLLSSIINTGHIQSRRNNYIK